MSIAATDTTTILFERHSARLYAFCLRRLGTREEADDAVQQTFMNAFAAMRRGFVPVREKAWLYRIAENVCIDHLRSSAQRRRHESTPAALESIEAIETPGRDRLDRLGPALASLAERQRRALVLREWHGLSYNEIARELSVSHSAVETLIFRARRSLARRLDAFSFVGTLKSLLTAGGAAKVTAAAVVTVGVGTLAADSPQQARLSRPASPPPAASVFAEPLVRRDVPPGRSEARNSELRAPAPAQTTQRDARYPTPAPAVDGSEGASNSELQAPAPAGGAGTTPVGADAPDAPVVAPAGGGVVEESVAPVVDAVAPVVEAVVDEVVAPVAEVVEPVVDAVPDVAPLPGLLP